MGKIVIGKKYGHLTVLKKVEPHIGPSGQKFSRYLCQCDCGNMHTVQGYMLERGQVTSCGCARKGIYRKEHWYKEKYPKIYNTWMRIKNRKVVCEEWENDFERFNKWYTSQPNYNNGILIRKDNTKMFSPENCEIKPEITVNYLGEVHTLKEWSIKNHINYNTIRKRYYDGCPVEDIVNPNDLRNERKMTTNEST